MPSIAYTRGDAKPATDSALKTDAPVGFYVVVDIFGLPITRIKREVYDFATDMFREHVRCELLARVDDAEDLPVTCHHAGFREDGKRLIQAWVPVE